MRRADCPHRANRCARRVAADERFRLGGRGVPHRGAHGRRLLPGTRGAAARYADLVWFETSTPDLEQASDFAAAVHDNYPGKLLAYNCSPSFNWRSHLDDGEIARFQLELAAMGYRFQFVTLAGFHSLNAAMFELARGYAQEGIGDSAPA